MATETPRWIPGPAFQQAVEFAIDGHRLHARKINAEPYIGHLFGVASLVIEYGGSEEQAMAAFLHDLLEDTFTSYEELQQRFGTDVADMVQACTDATHADKESMRDKSLDEKQDHWRARKGQYIENLTKKDHTDPSVLVALADKVNNSEKSARDLKNDPQLFDHFNAGIERQRWWYTELVKAFNKGNKFTDHQKVLLRRFEDAVASMFPTDNK